MRFDNQTETEASAEAGGKTETRQCPNCGLDNSIDRALCVSCLTPLTQYAGDLDGQGTSNGVLAAQVAALEVRPPVVAAMTVFNALFAVFWPLTFVMGAFVARQKVNAAGTNYLGAALGAVGPVLAALILLPVALGLGVLAWATWTRQQWAWNMNAGVLGLFGLLALFRFGSAPILAFLYLGLACGLAFYWFKPVTKAWFGA